MTRSTRRRRSSVRARSRSDRWPPATMAWMSRTPMPGPLPTLRWLPLRRRCWCSSAMRLSTRHAPNDGRSSWTSPRSRRRSAIWRGRRCRPRPSSSWCRCRGGPARRPGPAGCSACTLRPAPLWGASSTPSARRSWRPARRSPPPSGACGPRKSGSTWRSRRVRRWPTSAPTRPFARARWRCPAGARPGAISQPAIWSSRQIRPTRRG